MPDFSSINPAEATLLVGAIGLVTASVTLLQKWGADRRTSWWQRAQWALGLTLQPYPAEPDSLDDDQLDKLQVAYLTLSALEREGGVQPADYDVVTAAVGRLRRLLGDEQPEQVDTAPGGEQDEA